jgi:hypothetical protein
VVTKMGVATQGPPLPKGYLHPWHVAMEVAYLGNEFAVISRAWLHHHQFKAA